jgi:aryl-alcohol dehydrogenase-like predicted oxidoreductase
MMPDRIVIGPAGPVLPRLGLGCSRLGSMLGADAAQAARLLHHALDRGVTLFDTADIYGQGDSERLIGAAIAGRDDVTVITKAGQCFSPMQRLVARVKAPLRPLIRALPRLRGSVAQHRAAPLPRDYSGAHLRRAVEGSLRRLRRERIELFLLHSPSLPQLLAAEEGVALLARLVEEGKLGGWGVSADDAAVAQAAMTLPGLAALQLPLALAPALRTALPRAEAAGTALIWREIFTGARDAAGRGAALAAALGQGSGIALVGTTSMAHLDEALALLPAGSRP